MTYSAAPSAQVFGYQPGWAGSRYGPGSNTDDPSIPVGAYYAQAMRWQTMNAVLAGNQGIPRVFIEQLPEESDACYEQRLARGLLSPYTSRIIDAAVGLILRKPIHLEGGNEEWWEEWRQDVDRQGTSLDEFLRHILTISIGWGHCSILADYPDSTTLGVRTLRDQEQADLKPFLCRVTPWDTLGWRYDFRSTQKRMEQVRMREYTTEPDGEFGEQAYEQIRVLEPGTYRLYRRPIDAIGAGGGDWELYESGSYSLDEIPLAQCYSQKIEMLVSSPPLLEVAHLNLAHYKLQSAHLHALHTASFPILALMGWDDQQNELKLDVTKALSFGPDGDAKYVEPANNAFEAVQTELDALEEQMSTLGISTLAKRDNVGESGVAKAIDRADANSIIAATSKSLEGALQQAIDWCAEYAGQEPPTVGIDRDFDRMPMEPQAISSVAGLFTAGIIDQRTAIDMLRRGEVIGDEVDTDDIMEQAEQEAAASMEQALSQGLMLRRRSGAGRQGEPACRMNEAQALRSIRNIVRLESLADRLAAPARRELTAWRCSRWRRLSLASMLTRWAPAAACSGRQGGARSRRSCRRSSAPHQASSTAT